MLFTPESPLIAIACGGTGGHLFPGLAVGRELAARGYSVLLLVSEKEVDQQALKGREPGLEVQALPGVGSHLGTKLFLGGFFKAFRAVRKLFAVQRPQAILGMGGFTCAAPILAGKLCGAATFLHESNSIPGRANRWLAPCVDHVFISFGSATRRLHNRSISTTGTPVRPEIEKQDPASARIMLGLAPNEPVLLVMGGSQGASAINSGVMEALPLLMARHPKLQFLHLTGPRDLDAVKNRYATLRARAVTMPFLTEMDMAYNAATVGLCRSGASSLSESAAVQLPSILVPYPTAADNHQHFNATAFGDSGAAIVLPQKMISPERLTLTVGDLIENESARAAMQQALLKWHFPSATQDIANRIVQALPASNAGTVSTHAEPRLVL